MSLTSRTTVFLLVHLGALVGCGAADDAPADDATRVDEITRGVRDRGLHPAVVALRTDDGALCSGTLVGPRAVLTARHCVSVTSATIRCPSARAQALRELDPSQIAVFSDDDAREGDEVARGRRVVVPEGRSLCGADVAVLVLDRAVRGVSPLRLGGASSPRAGEAVTVVGFGRRGDSARAGVGERFYRASVPVLHVDGPDFVTGPSGCAGDSGGPALDPRSGRVVGVVSRGASRCAGPAAQVLFTRAAVAALLVEAARW